MRYAPETPTTEQLHKDHLMLWHHEVSVRSTQRRITRIIRTGQGFIIGIGPCALTDNLSILQQEAAALKRLEPENREPGEPDLVTVQRLNTWKPRSRPEDWHGMETDPNTVARAHEIVTSQAKDYRNPAMEVGYPEHAQRYKRALALGWLGARAETASPEECQALLTAAAECYEVPMGVKNGQDGELKNVLERVQGINNIRAGQGAPAFLIYRGSNIALTPQAWEDQYKAAWDLTGGALMVDTAHGAMRAHNRDNGKSVAGQQRAADHLAELARDGWAPRGVLMEASGTPSVVDPNAPFQWAVGAANAIAATKLSLSTTDV